MFDHSNNLQSILLYDKLLFVLGFICYILHELLIFFIVRINVPVNDFSVMSELSHPLSGINQYSGKLMCLVQGHNTVPPVGIKPRTSRFGV